MENLARLPLDGFMAATEKAIEILQGGKPMNGNLVLSRKDKENVHIIVNGTDVLVMTVVEVGCGRVRLAFNGDREVVTILRGELVEEATN